MRLAAFCCLLLVGCVSPSRQFLDTAKQYDFPNELQQGKPYLHRLFLNHLAQQKTPPYKELHVYLDGDGSPMASANVPSDDPTARNHLILELLSKDNNPAILLGRPCYYDLYNSIGCHSSLWTLERYSQEVVTSLVFVLQQWLNVKPAVKLTFIGYSGGGALVTLLARYFPQTSTVVTIAGNLDIQAWSKYHHYEPLLNSLNPIDAAQIPSTVKQFHLVGTQDDSVLAEFVEKFSRQHQNSFFFSFEDYDHSCCWADMWESFIEQTLK